MFIAPNQLASSGLFAMSSLPRQQAQIQTEFQLSFGFKNPQQSLASLALPAQSEDIMGESTSSDRFTPRGMACLWMAIAMALHFGGYEFARSSNLAMFTSPRTGFGSAAAFPFAMALVSPLSLLLLWGYNRELEENGPRLALKHTTLFSLLTIGGFALLFQLIFERMGKYESYIGKWLVGLAFIFQNSYAHLLYTQQWSFLGSVMTPAEGAAWFAAIAGLSSLSSTVTGSFVGVLVPRIGLYGLLASTVITLTLSMLCGDLAYAKAEKHGFDPSLEIQKKNSDKLAQKKTTNENMGTKAVLLFERVPSLKALFYEVLSFQSFSTVLNVCFVGRLKSTILDDAARAAWTGKFYAGINAVSGTFQFIIMPLFMKLVEPRTIWKIMPIIPAAASIVAALQPNPSLALLALAFFSAKTIDYSLRGVVTEMVYVPLDFESRYVGKEVIGVFANRFGKSVVSVGLSALTFAFTGFSNPELLTNLSTAAASTWFYFSWRLGTLVPKQSDAQEAVEERRKEIEKKRKKPKKDIKAK